MFVRSANNPLRSTKVSLLRMINPLLVMIYILVLLAAYALLIPEYWGYTGYEWNPMESPLEWTFVLTAALLPSFVMPVSYGRPSRLPLWMLYIVVYVPTCIVRPINTGTVGEYGFFIVGLLLSFLLLIFITELPLLNIPQIQLPMPLILFGLGSLTIVTMTMSVYFYGFPTAIPGLSEIYDVRLAQRSRSESAPLILAYLSAWQYKVINPLILAIGIHTRRPLLVGIGFFGQLFFFALTGHRSVLFSALLVLGVWFFTRFASKVLGSLALAVVSVGVIATSVLALAGEITWFSIFVRRLLVVPGSLMGSYHEFFTAFGFTGSVDPVSRLLFESPYDQTPAYLVGYYIAQSETLSANASFWASGFAGFGLPGIVIVTFILGVLLWVLNSLIDDDYRFLGNVLVLVSTFSLTNSELFTTIGTHGLGIATVLLLFRPKREAVTQESVKIPVDGRYLQSPVTQ